RALIDSVSSSSEVIAGCAVLLLAVFACQAGVNLAVACIVGEIGLAVVRDLRHRLYARLQRLGLSYYDRTPAGVILSRLTDDVSAVQNLITAQTLTLVTDLGTAAIVSAWLLLLSPWVFLTAAFCAPVYVLLFRAYTRRIREGGAEVRGRL